MAETTLAGVDAVRASGGGGQEKSSGDGDAPNDEAFLRDDASMVEALNAEVFNLKLAVHAYEERLAVLYQTNDRSRWSGTSSLLEELEAADRQVESLESEVAGLRRRLESSLRDADESLRDMDRIETERRSDSTRPENHELRDQHSVQMSELNAKIAGLEEDNRMLAHAAGWETGETVEEEERSMPMSHEQKRRLTAVEVLRARLLELAARAAEAEEKEVAAREAEGEASAEREKADARIAELYAAAQHYKRGKLTAEESMEALRIELARARRAAEKAKEEIRANAVAAAAAVTSEQTTQTTEPSDSQAVTQASQTEEDGNISSVNDRVARLEAELRSWQNACVRANEQLRQEADHAGETNRLLAEHDATIQELLGRLMRITADQSQEGDEEHESALEHQASSESEAENGNTSPAESGASTEEDATWSGVRASAETQRTNTNPDANTNGPIQRSGGGTTPANSSANNSNIRFSSDVNGSSTSSSINFGRGGELGSSADTASEAVAAAVAVVTVAAAGVTGVGNATGLTAGDSDEQPWRSDGQIQGRRRNERVAGNDGWDAEESQQHIGRANDGTRGGRGGSRRPSANFDGNTGGESSSVLSELGRVTAESSAAVVERRAGSDDDDGDDGDGRWGTSSSALSGNSTSSSSNSSSSRLDRRAGGIRGEEQSLSETVPANSSAETVAESHRVSFDVSEGTEKRDDDVLASGRTASRMATTGTLSAPSTIDAAGNFSAIRGDRQRTGVSSSDATAAGAADEEDDVLTSERTTRHSGKIRRRYVPSSGLTEVEGFSAVLAEQVSTQDAPERTGRSTADLAAERAENAAERAERSALRAACSAEEAHRDQVAVQAAATTITMVPARAQATVAAAVAPKDGSFAQMTDWPEGTASSERLEEEKAAREARRSKRAKRAARLAERAAVTIRLQQLAAATAAEETGSSCGSSVSSGSYDASLPEQGGGGDESPIVRNLSPWGAGGGQLTGAQRPVGGQGVTQNVSNGVFSREGRAAYDSRNGEGKDGAVKEEEKKAEQRGFERENKSPNEPLPIRVEGRRPPSTLPEGQSRATRRVQWVEESRPMSPVLAAPSPANAEDLSSTAEHPWHSQQEHGFTTSGADWGGGVSSEAIGWRRAERPPSRVGRFMPTASQMPPVDEEESEGMRSQVSDGQPQTAGNWGDITPQEEEEMWAAREEKVNSSHNDDDSREPWREGKSGASQGWTPAADNSFGSYVENTSGGSLLPVDLTTGTVEQNQTQSRTQTQNSNVEYWQRPVVEAASEKSASIIDEESLHRDPDNRGSHLGGSRQQADGRSFDETTAYGLPTFDQRGPSWDVPVPASGRAREHAYLGGRYGGSVSHGVRGGSAFHRVENRRPRGPQEFEIPDYSRSRRDPVSVESRGVTGRGRTAGGGVTGVTTTKKKRKKSVKRSSVTDGSVAECGHPHAGECARSCACPTCPCGEARAVSSAALWHARRRSLSTRA